MVSDGRLDYRKVPYQEKHVAQQASIVGNMEAFGLLRKGGAEVVCGENVAVSAQAVVEFGAGRGYLTQVLVDCYGIKSVFLVERRSYKLKVSTSEQIIMFSGQNPLHLYYAVGYCILQNSA